MYKSKIINRQLPVFASQNAVSSEKCLKIHDGRYLEQTFFQVKIFLKIPMIVTPIGIIDNQKKIDKKLRIKMKNFIGLTQF